MTNKSSEKNRGQAALTIVKRITSEELAERWRNGLCFHYNDKFGLGHVWKNKTIYVIWLLEADGDVVMEVEETTSEPEISVHVMAGFQLPNKDLRRA